MGLRSRSFIVSVVSSALVVTLAAPFSSAADDVVRATTDYEAAGRSLSGDVLLWEPSYTAGLRRIREIDVLGYGSGRSKATFVGSAYGRRVPSFTMAQKASSTSWAAQPVQHSSERLVATVPIRIGSPGAKRPVRARIYANCAQGNDASTKRCDSQDVAMFGGALVLLARTTIDGSPQATDIRIDSTGLSYRQLIRVAGGLRPVR